MDWLMRSSLVLAPDGPGSGGGQPPAGGASFPDLPADPSQDAGGDAGMSYIDEATSAMQAEDRPDDGWMGNQAPQPAAPQYPQPVQPGALRNLRPPGSAPQAQPGQPPRPGAVPQAQPGQQPPVSAPAAALPVAPQVPQSEAAQAAAREAERIRQDPFAYQSELIQQQEQGFIDALAQNAYAISDADMDAFLSGDSSKVSQALARVHVNSVNSVMKVVSQYMPIWVGNMLKLHSAAAESEAEFWEAAPYLNKKQHEQLAHTAARTVRQMQPNIGRPEMIRMVAAMVAAAAGVTPTGAVSNPAQQHQLPNGVRTPGRVVRNTPSAFQPAGMQSMSGPAPAGPDNPWAATTDILRADQAGMFDGQL